MTHCITGLYGAYLQRPTGVHGTRRLGRIVGRDGARRVDRARGKQERVTREKFEKFRVDEADALFSSTHSSPRPRGGRGPKRRRRRGGRPRGPRQKYGTPFLRIAVYSHTMIGAPGPRNRRTHSHGEPLDIPFRRNPFNLNIIIAQKSIL